MTHKLLALYGLKWNPFTADIPVEALWTPPSLDHFRWRMEHQVREGGFALITGDPGTGKSAALRLLAHHLAALPDVQVGVVVRPQSGLGDFYREIGALFGVVLAPHNRWAGFKALREKWLAHVEATRYRPVLLVDEAQEMSHAVLAELRILASTDFDSRAILTVVLVGDGRLVQEFRREALLPIASRIRARLVLDYLQPKDLLAFLQHALDQAGQPRLIAPEVMSTLAEHAAGNLRVLSTMANELLALAARRELPQIDQKLYLELFA
ncbi:MAG TPA: ATP-binding protein, partial [Thermoanaerobaculaceae bacterium]|nr:ATP-binding protein [Thermoanaerobaculaceae bacterium]